MIMPVLAIGSSCMQGRIKKKDLLDALNTLVQHMAHKISLP